MDDLITDQIEWLLSGNCGTNRMGRSIVTLSGFLSDGVVPEHIDKQLADLSKLVMLQDVFDALVQSLNSISRTFGATTKPTKEGVVHSEAPELGKLLDQIEAARQDMAACPTINYSKLIGWLVQQAREKKLLNKKGRR